jgi:hypothetical protein
MDGREGKMTKQFREASDALARAIGKARGEADIAYFDRVDELFLLVLHAARRQGVTDEAIAALKQYTWEREFIIEGNSCRLEKARKKSN